MDSFLFGVSLTRIAQQVPDAGELFVMPTGTSPLDYEDLFTNTRWRRLIAGFREVGALLIIAAPADAPHVHDLVDVSDGVVIVGDVVPPEVSVAQSLAWVRPRRAAAAPAAERRAAAAVRRCPPPCKSPQPAGEAAIVRAGSSRSVLLVLARDLVYWGVGAHRERRAARACGRRFRRAGGGGARPRHGQHRARPARQHRARQPGALSAGGAASTPSPCYAPANPARLGQRRRLRRAAVEVQHEVRRDPRSERTLRAASRGDLRHRVSVAVLSELLAGAFATRAGAESLLAQLRARRTLAQGFGSVDNFPLAFLVDSAVPAARGRPRVSHAMRRADCPSTGCASRMASCDLYFGAYANPEQAALAVPAVREAGIRPLLVYRIGRVF